MAKVVPVAWAKESARARETTAIVSGILDGVSTSRFMFTRDASSYSNAHEMGTNSNLLILK